MRQLPRPTRVPDSRAGFWIRWLATFLIFGQPHAKAEVISFAIDTNRSSVALKGSVTAVDLGGLVIALKEQGAGSLNAMYGGTIVADLSSDAIRFVGGSQIIPLESKAWEPGPNGADGTSLASYAAQASISFIAAAKAASRRLVFDATSTELPLQGGEFDVKQVGIRFVDTANSVIDFRVTGAVQAQGSKILSGLLTNRVSNLGKVSAEDGVQTLTIPIDATYSFVVEDDSGQEFRFDLIFAGQWVGTPAAPGAVVEFDPPSMPGGPLKLFWSPSYKLQRATVLSPPNWADYATESPVEIPTSQPGEYFRVVDK
jgi:hypothetical protein